MTGTTPPDDAGDRRGDGFDGDGIDDDGRDGRQAHDDPPAPRSHPLRTHWRQPLLTVIGMSAAVGLMSLIDPRPGPLVLAAVLAMTLSRNRLIETWRGRAESLVGLPVVGLATAGVGYLFVHVPVIGAVAYVAAMFLSIFLRRFGPAWSRAGSLIALPFITLFIAPGAGVGTSALEVALLSIGVLVIVVALRVLAQATRFLPRPQPAPEDPSRSDSAVREPASPGPGAGRTSPSSRPRSNLRPVASTRMAIQMAVALAAAFALGAWLFPQHVTWVALTAFIVCSGNRGRADVLYKSGLRIVGAAIGTIIASILLIGLTPTHPLLQGAPLVIALLIIIGIGLWLREWTYAAWAVVMTLVITLLQGAVIPIAAGTGAEQLWTRILAIIVGAACGLVASWFVLPVRSEGVVRRRVADALAALSAYADAPNAFSDRDLSGTLAKLDEVATPWRALERVTGWRATTRKPGQWMELVHECAGLVRRQPRLSGAARRALGDARRSMREPEIIGEKLLVLRDELQAR